MLLFEDDPVATIEKPKEEQKEESNEGFRMEGRSRRLFKKQMKNGSVIERIYSVVIKSEFERIFKEVILEDNAKGLDGEFIEGKLKAEVDFKYFCDGKIKLVEVKNLKRPDVTHMTVKDHNMKSYASPSKNKSDVFVIGCSEEWYAILNREGMKYMMTQKHLFRKNISYVGGNSGFLVPVCPTIIFRSNGEKEIIDASEQYNVLTSGERPMLIKRDWCEESLKLVEENRIEIRKNQR